MWIKYDANLRINLSLNNVLIYTMPNPPGITDPTYYRLYDIGDKCMKFERTFDPSSSAQQYIFIGMITTASD